METARSDTVSCLKVKIVMYVDIEILCAKASESVFLFHCLLNLYTNITNYPLLSFCTIVGIGY